MSTKKIVCDATVKPESGEYYGVLLISKMRYEDGSPVTVQRFLGLAFTSPQSDAPVEIRLEGQFAKTLTEFIALEPLDDATMAVHAKINFEESYTFDTDKANLSVSINGNLMVDQDKYAGSVELATDDLPGPDGTTTGANEPAGLTDLVDLDGSGSGGAGDSTTSMFK